MVNSLFFIGTTEARPFNIMKSGNSAASRDARLPMQMLEKPEVSNQVKIDQLSEPGADLEYGASSPLSLPPLESFAPLSLPDSAPPYCINPPFGPPSPSTTLPSPIGHTPAASPPPFAPILPLQNPPPSPSYNFACPPTHTPTPKSPHYEPSPPKRVPSPSGYQPPMVYPPPAVPSPPHRNPQYAVWCVAKPTVPDSIIQEALDYACGSGAECKQIQPNGHCFQPNTLVAHASYAFNSYWQKTKVRGGTCDFGGSAMLVTIDPRIFTTNYHFPEHPKRWRDYSAEKHFPEHPKLSPPLWQLNEVSFSHPDRSDFKLSSVGVGIVRPNGAGKSTRLNLLEGDLLPTEVESAAESEVDDWKCLLHLHPDQEGLSKVEAVREKLGKFGLEQNHLTPRANLSGRQKARIVLTSIYIPRLHVLLLDEPTNHLDMQSIDALSDALDEFTGGVVLVSHDSRLIPRVCHGEEKSETGVVEDGTLDTFPGTLEEHKEELRN
ncbi:hypothetical protein D5086_011875 [Populus alba]|uniref:Uncharacterized protein n=1 Tax=Populus alba TaxID=43335 RepID=A0ACC4C1B8_POPAL